MELAEIPVDQLIVPQPVVDLINQVTIPQPSLKDSPNLKTNEERLEATKNFYRLMAHEYNIAAGEDKAIEVMTLLLEKKLQAEKDLKELNLA